MSRVTHADELPYDGDAAGLSAEDVQSAIDELAAASPPSGGSFDPDEPLDYFTMRDGNGEFWTVTMGTDGAFDTTTFVPLVTEAGDRITTEAGDVLVME